MATAAASGRTWGAGVKTKDVTPDPRDPGPSHTGELMGNPPTGRPVDIDVLDFFQFRDGMLVEQWAAIDNLGMLRQIGVTQI